MKNTEKLICLNGDTTAKYAKHCALFLEQAQVFDLERTLAITDARIDTFSLPFREDAGAKLENGIHHFHHFVFNGKAALQNFGWKLTFHATPFSLVKDFCKAKAATLTIDQADERAHFLTSHIGPTRVARLLPQSLCNEDAEAYMHRNGHYSLQSIIQQALNLQ